MTYEDIEKGFKDHLMNSGELTLGCDINDSVTGAENHFKAGALFAEKQLIETGSMIDPNVLELVKNLFSMRELSESNHKWELDSETHEGGRWTTHRDVIQQDITYILERDYETETALKQVGTECTGAHGDGGHKRMHYIVALHNALPIITTALKGLSTNNGKK